MNAEQLLRNAINRLRAVAPPGLNIETIVENTIYTLKHDQHLHECDPQSILDATLDAISLGLDPSGLTREGKLIPRRQKNGPTRAVFVPDYRALIRIMTNNHRISHIETRIVTEKDTFQINYGDPTGQILTHIPALTNAPPRGAYAIAWFRDSPRPFIEYMTKDEIDAAHSRGPNNSAWDTDWHEMARKTVLKRLAKYLLPQITKAQPATTAPTARDIHPEPSENETPSATSSLAEQYRESIATAVIPEGLDAVINAIREDDRLDHMEKSELFNLACRRRKAKR